MWQITVSSAEPAPTPGGLRAAWSLLRRNRDFRRLYLASVVSLGGDWFLVVALFSLVLDLSDSPLAVSGILAAQDLTYFLLSPAAGALADRLDRRALMVAADVGRMVLVLGFLFVRTPETLWIAYPLLAAVATLAALFEPASAAALPNVVEPEDLGVANALSGSLWGTMLAVGAAVGGVVTATVGRDAAIAIDALSFGGSALLLRGITRPLTLERGEHAGVREATVETVRYARRDHRVLALIAVKFGWGIAGGVLVLIPLLAERFGTGEVGIGLLMAARGVGALVGPFVGRAAIGPSEQWLFRTISIALAVFGLGYLGLGFAPGLLLAVPAVVLAHTGGGATWTLSSYGLQRIVPDRIRGRVFAFDGMLVTLTFGTSSVLTGVLADRFGVPTAAVAMGAIALGWAIGWTLLTTDVRRRPLVEPA
ncbi:MAG: MFS transporter [Actinomycetota bacterium]